jgi:hypothetical protein
MLILPNTPIRDQNTMTPGPVRSPSEVALIDDSTLSGRGEGKLCLEINFKTY